MRSYKKYIAVAALLLPFWSLLATNYYVSNSGNDSANGLSTTTAWKTVAKVNSRTFSPGDSVLFRRGDTWREVLTVPSSGTATNYITFGAYGSGNKPRFFGEAIGCTTWTEVSPNIWRSATVVPLDPYQISWQSDIMVERTDGLVLLMYNVPFTSSYSNFVREYDWSWSGQRIYVYAPSNPGTRYNAINAPQQTHCIEMNDQEYLAFDNLDVRYGVLTGITDNYWTSELHGLRVTNCHIAGIGSLGGPYAYGIQSHHSDAYFAYNEIYSCGRRSISVNLYSGTPATSISNVIVENNYFHHGWHTTGFDCAIAEGSTGHRISDIHVRNNFFEGDPNQTFETGTAHGYPPSNHIFIAEQSDNNGGISNVYVYNNIFTYAHGKSIIFENLSNCWAVNNTVYGFNTNLDLWQSMFGTGYSTNCHILNNIFYHNDDNTTVGLFNSNSATTRPATLDYNLWYVERQGTNYIALVSLYQSGSNGFLYEYFINNWSEIKTEFGYELHSPPISNPLFTNPANNDFSLQAGSPAIGAAKPVSWLTTDYFGNARDPLKPSIGAVEYKSGTSEPTPPVYVSSVIENATPSLLSMTYSLTLANIVPAASAFTVMVNSAPRAVSSVAVSGTRVNLTLASPVVYGDVVTVAYTKPATNPLQTSAGGQAATITAKSVTNNVAAVLPVYVSSVIENATPSLLSMTYSLTLANIVPAASAFAVMVNSAPRAVSSVAVSGTRVNLTLASPVVYGDVVTVAYTKPATNPLQTSAGGQAATITAKSVTNNVAAVLPVYVSSVIENATPSLLSMTYSLTLANIVPAASAFTVMVNSAPRAVSSVAVSGTRVNLTLASPVVYGDVVTVAYTKPATNPLQTSAGGQAASITAQSVTNNCSAPGNQPPVITISSPTKNSTFIAPATITIEATASDPDGTISLVEFFSGTIKIGERISAPYSFTWKDVPEGTYSITTVATDNAGSKTVSVAVPIVVQKSTTTVNQHPNVKITSPAKSKRYKKDDDIVIEVTASDPDGTISKVELKSGNVTLAEMTTAPYIYIWQDVDTGKYQITAVATDNLGATSSSSDMELIVDLSFDIDSELINLYPNPNNGTFSIDILSSLPYEKNSISIITTKGQVIYKEPLDGDEYSKNFELPNSNPGTYILMITSGNKIVSTKKYIKR